MTPTPSQFSCPAEAEYFARHGAASHARAKRQIALIEHLSGEAWDRANKRSGGHGCGCDEHVECRTHRAAHRLARIVSRREP